LTFFASCHDNSSVNGELPSERDIPFSRLSHVDIASKVVRNGIVASVSSAAVWRWLNDDAIKPWLYRSWIFPRDTYFAEKNSVY